MTVGLPLLLALIVVVVASALLFPAVLRAATPFLLHRPRLALGLLVGAAAGWTGALLAVGPMTAWVFSGPQVLPGPLGEVCQRCVDASSPFFGDQLPAGVPTVVWIAPSLLLSGVLVVGLLLRRRRTRRAAERVRADLDVRGEVTVDGVMVTVVQDPTPAAFALPTRDGGIVVTDAALAVLDEDELRAVVRHEHAHLHQRHHLLREVLDALAAMLLWVPLIRAAHTALPPYLEVAADASAVRRTGVTPLAAALLKLRAPEVGAVALHVAGVDRIRHLVRPAVASVRARTRGVVVAGAVLALGGSATTILGQVGLAALAGCVV